jgi:hypothetical protein
MIKLTSKRFIFQIDQILINKSSLLEWQPQVDSAKAMEEKLLKIFQSWINMIKTIVTS